MRTLLPALTRDALLLLAATLLLTILVACAFWTAGVSPLPVQVHAAVLPDGREIVVDSPRQLPGIWAANPGAPKVAVTKWVSAPGSGNIFLVSIALSLVAFGVLAAVRSGEASRAWFRGGALDVVWGLVAGIGLLAFGWGYGALLAWLGIPVIDVAAKWTSLGSPALLAILACVAAPIGEEAYFRGRIHGLVATSWSGPAAIAVSAALFAAFHVLPQYLPITFLFGCVLGWLRVRRGNLIAPIVAHAVNNGVGLFLLG